MILACLCSENEQSKHKRMSAFFALIQCKGPNKTLNRWTMNTEYVLLSLCELNWLRKRVRERWRSVDVVVVGLCNRHRRRHLLLILCTVVISVVVIVVSVETLCNNWSGIQKAANYIHSRSANKSTNIMYFWLLEMWCGWGLVRSGGKKERRNGQRRLKRVWTIERRQWLKWTSVCTRGENGHGHAIFVSLHSFHVDSMCTAVHHYRRSKKREEKNYNGIYKSNNNGISLSQQYVHCPLWSTPLDVERVM